MPIGVGGTTNVLQSANNQNTYCSEYGDHTVSVKIAILYKSLRLLAHELGHVNYQVPNLAAYAKYYVKHYSDSDSKLKGHNSKDPSAQQVKLFEKRFIEQLQVFSKDHKNKIASPRVLLETIRKSPLTQVRPFGVQNDQ